MGAAVQRSYSAEEIEAGLHQLALCNRNAREAERRLALVGLRIPNGTLYDWRSTHADRLGEIEREELPKVRSRMAAQQAEVAELAAEITVQGLKRLREKLPSV